MLQCQNVPAMEIFSDKKRPLNQFHLAIAIGIFFEKRENGKIVFIYSS